MSDRYPWAVIDIETGPDPKLLADESYGLEVLEEMHAPSNYKDPLKIAAWQSAALLRHREKMALSPATGVVRCVGLMFEDGTQLLHCGGELDTLRQTLNGLAGEMLALVGFNLREFDLPFLHTRCAIHGLPAHELPALRDHARVIDLRDCLIEGNLGVWMRAFGLGKRDVTGKAIANLSDGELAEHCRQDLKVTHTMAKALKWAFRSMRIA